MAARSIGVLCLLVLFAAQAAFGQANPVPEIDLKQTVSDVVANVDGTYSVEITLTVSNTGNEDLVKLQLKDNLDIFGPDSSVTTGDFRVLNGELTLNPGFDGFGDIKLLKGKDKLRPGKRAALRFTLSVDPGDTFGPYRNTAVAWAEGKHSGRGVDDRSRRTFSLRWNPEASFEKSASEVEPAGNGAFRVTFTLDARNTGNEELVDFQLKDDLDIFADGRLVSVGTPQVLDGELTLNPTFDGISDIRLLAGHDSVGTGDRARLRFDVTFEPGESGETCINSALAWSEGELSGIEVDVRKNISFDCSARELPVISLTKTAGLAANIGDGLYSREITLVVSNPGTVDLDNVQVSDPLTIFGAGGALEAVQNLRNDDQTFDLNPAFNGDNDINLLAEDQFLAVDASATLRFTVLFRPGDEPGPFPNTATATGDGGSPRSTTRVTASDDILLPDRPVVPPEISLTKAAGLAADEGDGLYSREITLVVSNPGTVDLDNVQVSDPLIIFGMDGELVEVRNLRSNDLALNLDPAFDGDMDIDLLLGGQNLLVGESATIQFTVFFRPGDEPGPFPNTATATGEGGYPRSTTTDTATDNIFLPQRPSELTLTKAADRYEVARGDIVIYTVTVTNTGQADSPGNILMDDLPAGFQFVPGTAYITRPGSANDQAMIVGTTGSNPVSFAAFDLDAGSQAIFTYQTRVGTGVADGKHKNIVTLTPPVGPSLDAVATVRVGSENGDPMFESTTIIGKVFNDSDSDGNQGDGEPGIAGVRLATVSGLTIETDQFGRFHIADVAVSRFDRGANFILKVDESTLPDGAHVTSENPRVIRLTQGTMSKFNFAVDVPENVVPQRTWDCIESCVTYQPVTEKADIEPVLFESGASIIPANYEEKLKEVLAEYQGKRNVYLRFVGHTDSDRVIGRLAQALGARGAAGNVILSENRARKVCEYVETNFDVPVDCSRIEGKGQSAPVATNATPEGKASNRRVEIEVEFLEIANSITYEKVDYERCEISDVRESPLFWSSGGPSEPFGDEPLTKCSVHKQYFDPDDAAATDIRISGGLFGCNQLVDPDFGGQSGGLRPRERELTANASKFGDAEFPADNCTFTPYYQENCLTKTAIGATPGQYPVEIRTCAGSVLRVTENGDVQRAGFPDNNERIVVSPFRDEKDNSKISAFRIINEGVERGPDRYDQSAEEAARNTSAWVSTDPFVMDPRLDVLATDHAIVDSHGQLRNKIDFAVYTNYAKFIDDYVIELFGRMGSNSDRKLLATLPADLPRSTYAFDQPFTLLPNAVDLNGYSSIEYVVRARRGCVVGQNGPCFVDRTEPRVLTLQSEEPDAKEPRVLTRQSEEPDVEEPLKRDELWGMSNLAEQNIPIIGDRVRVQGKHTGPETNLWIDEELRSVTDSPIRSFYVPLGPKGKFVLEQYVPIGRYRFSVRKSARDPNIDEVISADANDIRVSGGLFGCRVLAGGLLPGRVSGNDEQVLALTVVGDPFNKKSVSMASAANCPPGILPGRSPVLIETREGSRIEINSTGDTIYSPYPGPLNNQQIVVTPFRDYTDSTVVSALRIENEGVATRLVRNDLPGIAFDVDVVESESFLVALANVTIGENNVSGNIATLSADDHYDGALFTDGRLAMYAKGKIQGKYLVTAQLDTTEDELSNMGDNLKRRDPRRLFRQLDPDRYYAVYGDDSTTTTDVDTQGALYVRVDWNRNTALWGNFNTGITDTEFAQYNRTLYGAAFKHESQQTTISGDSDNELTLFASEAQSVPAHVTFKATGGSLYYLRDTDIVMGSEKAWIEVRRRDSQQVVEKQVLIEGRDYEIDALQGRIILDQPLSQVVNERQSSIIRSTPLEGDEVYLLVDYEYVPAAFVADDMVLGARGKKWLGDHVGIGGTAITDQRGDTDYDLEGLDIVIKGQEGTYLSAEFARSQARQSDANSVSFDGGLSFQSQISANPGDSLEGDAIAFDGRLNLADLGIIEGLDGAVHGWWKSRDADFSTGRLGQGIDVTDSGVEMQATVRDFMTISAKHTELKQEQISSEKVTSLKAEGKGERLSLGVELRHEEVEQLAPGPFGPVTGLRGVIGDGEALLVGARVGYDLTDETTIYASAQTATDKKGLYENNDLVTVGVNSKTFGDNAVSLEVSDGDRGSALTAGMELGDSDGLNFSVNGGVGSGAINQFATRYSVADGHELYGSYTVDPDRTDGARNLLTLGQRRNLGNHLAMFTESQFGKSDSYADIGHVFGMEFDGIDKLTISSTVQFSENNHSGVQFDRQALSLGASLRSDDLKLSSRIEYREDQGLAVHNRQYISSNSLFWRRTDERFWAGRLNLSWTDDELNGGRVARFVEFDIGHTYRPTKNDRFNLLSKYSFLYDLPSEGQNTFRADERSHLLSVEGLYDLSNRWELAAKLALRKGEIRLTRDSGPWQEFGLRMASVRARYTMTRKWDALAEYRWLSDIKGTNDRHGALLGLYRHVGDNFKIGVGFNFTDFNSDLRIDRYDNHGWFVDLIGKY